MWLSEIMFLAGSCQLLIYCRKNKSLQSNRQHRNHNEQNNSLIWVSKKTIKAQIGVNLIETNYVSMYLIKYKQHRMC
jgi:hypothetical protein